MVVLDAAPFPGLVTEDGTLLLDHPLDFKVHCAQFAGQGVIVAVRPWISQTENQREYFHAVVKPYFRACLLERFREEYGAVTLDEAYEVLVRNVLNLPHDVERASTAVDAMDFTQYSAFINRCVALMATVFGATVPLPEPDPVVRWMKRKKARRVA